MDLVAAALQRRIDIDPGNLLPRPDDGAGTEHTAALVGFNFDRRDNLPGVVCAFFERATWRLVLGIGARENAERKDC